MSTGKRMVELMRHAVGAGYRNSYAADPSGQDAADWVHLCELGLAVRGSTLPGGLVMYHVSVAGVAMLRALHPRELARELKGAGL